MPKKPFLKSYRDFQGERYDVITANVTKKRAEAIKMRWKKQGYKVRIVKTKTHSYVVYRSRRKM